MSVLAVNVICTSYSGNTWLNLMLGAHSRAFCVGEYKNIRKTGRVNCMLHGADCPVWSRFDASAQEHPYLQLGRLTGKNILVISNSLDYLPADPGPGIEQRFIHLIRDGRAVAASFRRKHRGMNIWQAARRWRHDHRKNLRRLSRHPAEAVLPVRYEELKSDPEREVRRICGFLGIPFEPSMLEYWTRDMHYLGGNQGTLLALARKQGGDLPESSRREQGREQRDWKLEFYAGSDPQKFTDDRWKSDLTSIQLGIFNLAAGGLNRRLGYQ